VNGSHPGARAARAALLALAVSLALPAALVPVAPAGAAPLATTRHDFELPGTQPLTVTDTFAVPSACTPCHANYGATAVEPYRNWQGSMMAQSGRDPLMLAALAIANQDAPHAGETCLRCHYPKGWLEGRSVPEDGSAMTADDRQGVQCTICHRLVDPFPAAENPPQDTAILAALGAPVPLLGSAMMVLDPLDRLRGPFDVVTDLGFDPHAPTRTTIVSPFHASSDVCGTCHNVENPLFTRDLSGEYVLNALDTPGTPGQGFPEQSTYSEWAASTYATTGVPAPQFGRNLTVVSTCQDCHMPAVSGRDANLGIPRDDLPLHELVGGNTFVPHVLPYHPAFGGEVNGPLLEETVGKATNMLRRAATVAMDLAGGTLTVRVTNETGHKLPTGYPDGRRMWLHVRAYDAARAVVFESGRYLFATADLVGYGAQSGDPDYDPNLHVWEAVHGTSPALAALVGGTPGPSEHLILGNVREKDNRIPPRGFTNAAYDAFDGAPVGATYADGQYWDEVTYPVGAAAVQAEATLYYQTASREYVEFLRDENVTNAAGPILFDLWDQHEKAEPVALAHGFVQRDTVPVSRCQKAVAKAEATFWKHHDKEWGKCFAREAQGLSCDAAGRDARIAAAEAKLRAKVGGVKDRRCAALNFTPITLGHGSVCPVPCASQVLFDMSDVASCAACMAGALTGAALEAAYGVAPPDLPATLPGGAADACQRRLAKATTKLALRWTDALARCEDANRAGAQTLQDCSTDPTGAIGRAQQQAAAQVARCDGFAGLQGCALAGTAAGTTACIESAIGAQAPAFTGVAYP
jgi:hypothetical protein